MTRRPSRRADGRCGVADAQYGDGSALRDVRGREDL